MWGLGWANVVANRSRFVAALLAITIGVAFLTAGSMLTTSIERSLGGEVDAQYGAVNAAIRPQGEGRGLAAVVVPAALLDEVRSVDGVDTAVGEVIAPIAILKGNRRPEPGTFGSGQTTVRAWIDDPRLNPLDLVEGRAPRGTGEVTVDRRTAVDRSISLGDTIRVSSAKGATAARVVGITSFGTSDAPDPGGTLSAAAPWVFQLSGDGSESYARLLVVADAGVTDGTLVDRLRAVVPATYTVLTGPQFLADEKGQTAAVADVLGPVLQGFAYLSLFVCAVVIYNTFNVVVSQRTRELALIRAIAATPKQVRRSLKVEGAVVGLTGSVLGLGLGAGLTLALVALLRSLDIGLPSAGVVVTVDIVVRALLSGLVVTVVASAVPARRAARTPPAEAMRASEIEPARLSRVRVVVAAVFAGAGVAAMLVGSPGWLVGVGAFAFLIGVFLSGPALVLLAVAVARPLARRGGVASRLAVENLARAPKRTATTANALLIGLFLVTLVTVGGASLRDWTVEQVNSLSSADFIVTTLTGPMPPGLLDKIDATDGVARTARLRSIPALDGAGQPTTISASDPASLQALGLVPEKGSWATAGGGVVTAFVDGQPAALGQTVRLTLADGKPLELPVTATLPFSLDALTVGNLVLPSTLDRIAPDAAETGVLVRVRTGTQDAVKERLDTLSAGYGNVFVIPGNILGQVIGTVFNFLITAVNALLGMSVVIALIGIVNTLSLSIFERRRELGLLRAVGMSTGEVRRMVLAEAVMMSMVGTLAGMVSGGLLAWLLLRAADLGGGVTLEPGRLGLIAGVGLVAGLVAAALPARRVTRLDVISSLEST